MASGCKKKPSLYDKPIEEIQARAAKFEPVFAVVKTLPTAPPPLTHPFVPAGVAFDTVSTPGVNDPKPYLVLHAEDLAAPPKYYATTAAPPLRLNGSGAFSGCAAGLTEVKATKATFMNENTLMACTEFKYAFLVHTTRYVAPANTSGGSDTVEGNTRKIVEAFTPGHVSAEVTIYDLANGHAVGGFKYDATSSSQPSMDGGFVGALDRDLAKNANAEAKDAFYAAMKGASAPTASAKPPHAPKSK